MPAAAHALATVALRVAVVSLCLHGLSACHRTASDEHASATAAGSSASAPATVAVSKGEGAASRDATRPQPDFTRLVKEVGPSVVNVTSTQTVPATAVGPGAEGEQVPDFLRRFFGAPPGREPRGRGLGSGLVIDSEGFVLTNAHVVASADRVTVRLSDSPREYKAQVIGSDRQTDLALLKLDAHGALQVARLGDSRRLQIGEWVAAIGSPFGFTNSITAGIVSAKERALPDESVVPFIQTDVAVNPGNSGGPLLNTGGEVVGINSQIYSRTGGYMGVSFAIPIDVAMDVARQLRNDGRVTRGRLGVGIQTVSEELANAFKLDAPRGALVTSLQDDAPARKAGVAVGDVILRFAGRDVVSANDLPRLVAWTQPGTALDIDVWHDGATRTLHATVGSMPEEQKTPRNETPRSSAAPRPNRLGIAVEELPPAGRSAFGVDYGLVVRELQPPNDDSGLRRGDVIVALDQQPLRNLDQFKRRAAEAQAGSSIALLVRRIDGQIYVPVTVGVD